MGKRSKSSHGRSNPKSSKKRGGKGGSKGGAKGGGKGRDKVIKKGKLKNDGGKGAGKKDSQERSKSKGGGKGDDGDGGKGSKGKGKGKGSAPALTRKQRKQAAVARSKGLPPPGGTGAKPEKPAVTPVGQKATKKGKKRLRPGQNKRKGEGEKPKSKAEEVAEKPKKKRIRPGRHKRKKADAEEARAEPVQPKCRNGHTMGQRSDNPPAYKNEACCDVCGKEKMAKKLSHFFHCSFCRFDLCPNCAKSFEPAEFRKKVKEAPFAILTAQQQKKKQKEAAPGVPGAKARREIWIPTEADAVSRAPVDDKQVVSAWVEGMPV
eukprot:TRINITY_DN62154_c0_g1_i1.p1 TRINITY_DN62154_c0_g1~~TRINITY_DN62154_c0_g1_i1.p1  ORF type:complete len:334 (+),score=87.94 TRINITY_DN62154_c0_g1_i1:44-1003(+)